MLVLWSLCLLSFLATKCTTDAFNPTNYDLRKPKTLAFDPYQQPPKSQAWFQDLLDCFVGDFDNYNQVVEDQRNGRFPGPTGGHEHIHCKLLKVEDEILLPSPGRIAVFYFDGNPTEIFRLRYYRLMAKYDDAVEMRIYQLSSELEASLRAEHDMKKWAQMYLDFNQRTVDDESSSSSSSSNTTSMAQDDHEEIKTSRPPRMKQIANCDILWRPTPDPEQHHYIIQHPLRNESKKEFHGIMKYGFATVKSTRVPNLEIRVTDQLHLFDNCLWINDKGVNATEASEQQIMYGNHANVPYQLERVTRGIEMRRPLWKADRPWNLEATEVVTNKSLKWTLGPHRRTEAEYREKMDAVGGGTSNMMKHEKRKTSR